MKITVIDLLLPTGAPSTVDADASYTVAELKALILSSLRLPSGTSELMRLCHDGKLLEDDEQSLDSAGIAAAPVVVILSPPANKSQPQQSRSPPPVPPPAPAAAAAEPETPPEDAVCRICFGSAYENGLGRLISPCMCSGSMRYVHVQCLNDWRSESANPRSFTHCDQCGYAYNVQRTEWAAILENPKVIKGVTGLLLLAAVIACALVLGPLGAAYHFYNLVRLDPRWLGNPPGSSFVASIWCWQLDVLVSGLLGVAIFGVGTAVRDAYRTNRFTNHSWILGVVTALATSDVRIYRVFALFGGLAAAKSAQEYAEHTAKLLLTKWGTAILEVRR